MDLFRATRANRKIRMAIVGGGGKTSTMFNLARQFSHASIVTASTHLGCEQAAMADNHIIISPDYPITDLSEQDIKGVTLISKGKTLGNRLGGLSEEELGYLHEVANRLDLPMIIEADGSRQIPIKAPAEHEPAIPSWVNTVLYVVGLSGLGKPINDQNVHRPQRFMELSGAKLGEIISIQLLKNVLCHPQGGLKNIPEGARKILFFNQADTILSQAIALEIMPDLLEAFDQVLIGSLQNPNHLSDSPIFAVHEPVSGVILAAGGSTRFGKPKLLIPWKGSTLIRHVAQTVLQSALKDVTVVTGSYHEEVTRAVSDLPLKVVESKQWQSGQSASMQTGIRNLPNNSGAAFFFLGDQPFITPQLINGMIERHYKTLAPVIIPQVEGKRSNPVLFDRGTFPDLMQVGGDQGGRAVFSKFPMEWFPWNDARLLLDIDTPEDYEQLLNK